MNTRLYCCSPNHFYSRTPLGVAKHSLSILAVSRWPSHSPLIMLVQFSPVTAWTVGLSRDDLFVYLRFNRMHHQNSLDPLKIAFNIAIILSVTKCTWLVCISESTASFKHCSRSQRLIVAHWCGLHSSCLAAHGKEYKASALLQVCIRLTVAQPKRSELMRAY